MKILGWVLIFIPISFLVLGMTYQFITDPASRVAYGIVASLVIGVAIVVHEDIK